MALTNLFSGTNSSNGAQEPMKERIIQRLMPLAEHLIPFFPNLKKELIQAEMDEQDDVRYLASSLYSALNTTLMITVAFGAIVLIFENYGLLQYLFGVVPITFLFSLFTTAKQPEIQARKRQRLLEKELPYALRHILIEVESGIPLYQAMVAITDGYGEASSEFEKIVNEINAGTSEVDALENAILRNPSQQFRRGLWQLINALRSGADVSTTLESLVDSMIDKQVLAVEEYGKELNPYTLMYMLVAVIMPSLGVTFLMILSTFTGMNMPDILFYGILVGLAIFQILFINLVSSKRPLVKT